jgi:hypothetical protein
MVIVSFIIFIQATHKNIIISFARFYVISVCELSDENFQLRLLEWCTTDIHILL